MGNTESNIDQNQNYDKEQIEYRRSKQQEIMNKLRIQQNNSKTKYPIKKSNHLDNLEVKNTILRNKTMQKQLFNKMGDEYKKHKNKIKSNEYSNVNNYLDKLDILEPDYENNNDRLYINQGHIPENKVVFSKEDSQKKFKKSEKLLEKNFKQDEKKRRLLFLEQQKKRRSQYDSEIKHFDKSNIDPYELFNLKKDFNLDDLKSMYKKLALVTHPDRPNGSEEKFQLVTKAYLSILEKYKTSQADKQYLDLRDESNTYLETQKNNSFKNIDIPNEKDFDVNLFNKIYDDNKLEDENDLGYNDWIENNQYDTEEIQPSKVFSNKFNLDVFNQTFQTTKKPKDIIKYEEPQSLYSSSINCTELGQSNISNYGKNINSYNELAYTDYKQAYTTGNIINPGDINHKNYKDLEDLKTDRNKVCFQMSESDARNQQLKLMKEKEHERVRLDRVKNRDQDIFNNYSKVHKLLLKK